VLGRASNANVVLRHEFVVLRAKIDGVDGVPCRITRWDLSGHTRPLVCGDVRGSSLRDRRRDVRICPVGMLRSATLHLLPLFFLCFTPSSCSSDPAGADLNADPAPTMANEKANQPPPAPSSPGQDGGTEPPTPDAGDAGTPNAPPDPTSLSIGNVTTSGATITWKSGGGTTKGYRVLVATSAPPASCPSAPDVAATTFAATSLMSGTAYTARVCAVSDAGLVSAGALVTFTTSKPPLAEITSFRCTDLTSSVRVRWNMTTPQARVVDVKLGTALPAACDAPISKAAFLNGGTGWQPLDSRASLRDFETRVVWVCGYDPLHPMKHTPGLKMRVDLVRDQNGALVPGSCALLP
jgi:hypothetical protein